MPLPPSLLTKYYQMWFSRSNQEPRALSGIISSGCPLLESLPDFPLDLIDPISLSREEESRTFISSLPVELLREIFLWSVRSPSGTYDQHSAPLNLSHTCCLWRQLAIGNPKLWNGIVLDNFKYPAKMLELWIERAKGSLLSLNLRTMDMDVPRKICRSSDPNIRAAQILIRHAPQWQDLRVSGAISQNTSFLLLKPSMLANLRRCEWIFFPNIPRGLHRALQTFEHFWTIACSAPLLQDVRLCKIPNNAPWSQLINLTLCGVQFSPATDALSQCTSLKSLHWQMDRRARLIPFSPLVIPKLSRLTLTSYNALVLVSLFDAFTLPHLTSLHLFICTLTHPMPKELVTGMLSRLHLPLQHFSLVTENELRDDIIAHLLPLSCFHHLKHLSLPAVTHIDDLCTLLRSSAHLPDLQALDVGIKYGQQDTQLVHALHSRIYESNSRNQILQVVFYKRWDGPLGIPPQIRPPADYCRSFKSGNLPNVEVYLKLYHPETFIPAQFHSHSRAQP